MSSIRRTGLFLLPLGLLAPIYLAFGGDPRRGLTDSSRANSETGAQSGADRMRARLAQIALEASSTNPYFGDAIVNELESALAAAPANALVERWRHQYLLGWHLLRLGRNEEALERLTAAKEIVPRIVNYLASGKEQNFRNTQLGTPIPGKETAFDLGIAWMRQAEKNNCCKKHTGESCILPLEGGARHADEAPARHAMACFREVLASYPDHLASRWLLCVAAMAIGEYPAAVPERFRMVDGALESDEPFPKWKDVAPDLGLDDPDPSGGVVLEDFDADGDLDVVTSSIDPTESLNFHRNDGDGKFTDRSHDAGFDGILGGLNMVQADVDNDGDVDLFVLRGAWWNVSGQIPNSLLLNDGAACFTDKTYEAGLADPAYPTQAAGFADFDLDGDLDLFVGNESEKSNPCPSQLYRNNGDGTFTDVAKAAGVENLRFAKAVSWGDVDNDRDPDLYVSNLGTENRLYRNNGDGTFTDVAASAGVTRPLRSFPTWFFDYDNDGNLDLFVSSYWNQPQYVVARCFGQETDAELSCLYKGDGKGRFEDVAQAMNLVKVTMPMGANFGDLDNDGFLDFYLGTGYPNYEGLIQNFMYWNRGGRKFADVSLAGGFAHLQKGHAVAFGDLDNDGDQDVFEQMGGAFKGDGFSDVLFENPGSPGAGNHWLKVRLVGVKSNRFGVGARIRADVVDGGKPRSIYKWVNSGASFGCNPLRQEIGLGTAARVTKLEIHWPASDTTQVFEDVAGDTCVEITEGSQNLKSIPIVRCNPH